jgi:hypothetical protein
VYDWRIKYLNGAKSRITRTHILFPLFLKPLFTTSKAVSNTITQNFPPTNYTPPSIPQNANKHIYTLEKKNTTPLQIYISTQINTRDLAYLLGNEPLKSGKKA